MKVSLSAVICVKMRVKRIKGNFTKIMTSYTSALTSDAPN